MARPTLAERFWRSVDTSGDCWLWQGSAFRRGYGKISVGNKHRKAHRVVWEMTVGPIPDGLNVLHQCDTPACVRPSHLFLGTPADNIADMVAKGRHARGDRSGARLHPDRVARGDRNGARLHPDRVARGEQNGSSKLTAAAVADIRARVGMGETKAALARAYRVSDVLVGMIVRGEIWREEMAHG